MTALYLETSALLAWLLDEPEADAMRGDIDAAATVVTSVLTAVEMERAVARAVAGGVLREAQARRLIGALARARASLLVMGLTDEVAARAGAALPVGPVRTLEAIHLATALRFAEVFPELRLLTLKRRVSENAVALGIGS